MKFVILFIVAVLSGQVMANCKEGLEAFKKTLHPMLQQRCANCHGDDGIVVEHSQSNPNKAYVLAKKYANFQNIYASTFVRKVKAAHWIEMDPDEMGMTEAEMTQELNAWWEEGEKVCPPALTTVSAAQQLPVNLPLRSSGTYTTLSWNLTLRTPSPKKCEIKVDIQQFTEASGAVPGAFRLKEPRIKCDAGTMTIKGVRFLLNGIANTFENIYEDVDAEINHDGSEKILSSELMIVIDQLTDTKELSVGFSEIKLEVKSL